MRLEIEVGRVLASGIAGDLVRVSAVETAGDLGLRSRLSFDGWDCWRSRPGFGSWNCWRSRPSFGVEAAAGIGVEDLRSGFGAHIEGASRPRFGAQLFQKWPSTIKDATSCNLVNETGTVAKEISSASPALPKKILLTKQNHSTMTVDRKTSMTYESSSDEDDDRIAKAPTKRPKKDPDLPDLSSPGHSQEFIGFETEDQFDSPVDNTVIAKVNEVVVAALADDNQGKHISPFNVVEIAKDATQAILESFQGMRDYLAAAKAAATSSYNSSLNIATKATDESKIKGFMKQLVEGIHAYNQAMMEYNAGQTLTEKIQSTIHILQAHLHIYHEGKEELDKLEEEQKKIKAIKSTILAKIDNAVQDSRPHQVELETFMQQQADFQEKEDGYKTLISARAELWVNFKTVIQKHL
ncbi:PREDICTED: PRUPE_6G148400 [Prunus dulcis]|uniref:PREDICTED: PRUPE_6G148400 n=1 Tax=Prunus dulcis TaxID=3755 RepID=A0A5E4G9V5_PRUDU|nr:PREDICTED: PRUPE_6G148400 [Prunus dulcis]